LGVDLFFALSGFILCHRYLAEMGPRLDRHRIASFFALRFARLYPVHLFMILVVALYAVALHVRRGDSLDRSDLGWRSLTENLLLVHAWWNQPASWNGPSWSISLEWLAYLFFPFIVMLVWRIGSRGRSQGGIALFVVGYLPLVLQSTGILELKSPGLGLGPGLYLLRILGGFVGGCAVFLLARAWDAQGHTANRRFVAVALASTWMLLVAVVFWFARDSGQVTTALTVEDYTDFPRELWAATPLLAVIVGLTSLPTNRVGVLGSRYMVIGGLFSYSLYMTHAFVLEFFGAWYGGGGWLAGKVGISELPWYGTTIYLGLVLGIAFLVAYFVWKFVEEPSRRALRRRLVPSANPLPVEEREANGRRKRWV